MTPRANAHDEEQRMLGVVRGERAVGRGPATDREPIQVHHHGPAAGWGAAKSVSQVLARTQEPLAGPHAIVKMNHENGGFDCPGCAWPDDRKGLRLDICENGIKHVTWELTRGLVGREFFGKYTVSELATWSDYDLEVQGRLAEPMVYDATSDHYVPIGWEDAFALVGSTLRSLASPHEAAFYTSGRLGNEATFLYQLWVREFGTNNLPDCSNMCHEASGRALTAALGTGKGTVTLTDWEEDADALFVIGINAATNTPRMLTALAEAYRRGAQIVHINPLVESGATRTTVPHEFLAMATFRSTPTSTLERPAPDRRGYGAHPWGREGGVNTTIYSNDDRSRGIKNLRTLVFLNKDDMRARGLANFDFVDITSIARDGSVRSVYGYRAVTYDLPQGSAVGYMPELNVLCALADYSSQSDQPMFKHLVVDITAARNI